MWCTRVGAASRKLITPRVKMDGCSSTHTPQQHRHGNHVFVAANHTGQETHASKTNTRPQMPGISRDWIIMYARAMMQHNCPRIKDVHTTHSMFLLAIIPQCWGGNAGS
jgi:hypothetical protein